jgi:hypothetical protein
MPQKTRKKPQAIPQALGQTEIQKAIKALGIDVPYYYATIAEGVITIHLYGGRVLTWPPERVVSPEPSEGKVTT